MYIEEPHQAKPLVTMKDDRVGMWDMLDRLGHSAFYRYMSGVWRDEGLRLI